MAKEKRSDTTSWNADSVRQAQTAAPAPKKNKKKKKHRKHPVLGFFAYIICVVLISAILAGVGWLLANDLFSLNKAPVSVTIVVDENDSVEDVAQKLQDAGLINYKWFFCLTGRFLHAKETIEPGVYENITSDMDYRALILALHHYQTFKTVQVTINEGKTVREIIDILAENGVSTKEKLEDTAANYEFKGRDYLEGKELGQVNRLEGYLFPDTYDFYIDGDPAQAFEKMMDNFENRLKEDDLMDEIEDSGYTLDEIIILASIIEKESNDFDEERANIASVIYNRLNTKDRETYGMLQMDSTIDYALALDGKDRTEFSKEYPSPYNTYTFAGFPKGAICNPGLASIKAAVHPNDTNYYYFAAGIDGHSHFFTNLTDHINFINSDQYKGS